MSKVEVAPMTWGEMAQLVESKFNKLAMCKRGMLATDIANMREELGDPPQFTKEEKEKIDAGLNKKIQKAMTPTVAMVKKYSGSPSEIATALAAKARKITKNKYKHPDLDAYNEKLEMIREQAKAREATLDGDFQDVLDSFKLKLWDLDDLPNEYMKMEAKEW
jgi:hypothetical protein